MYTYMYIKINVPKLRYTPNDRTYLVLLRPFTRLLMSNIVCGLKSCAGAERALVSWTLSLEFPIIQHSNFPTCGLLSCAITMGYGEKSWFICLCDCTSYACMSNCIVLHPIELLDIRSSALR